MTEEDSIGVVRRAVERARKRVGVGAKPLAKRAGLGETTVRDIEKGYSKDFQIGTLAKIAAELGVSLPELFQDGDGFAGNRIALGPTLPVRGEVAAGVWRDAIEFPEDDWQTFTGRPDISAPLDHRFGLRVYGDSMNLIYPHGTIVECVSVFGGAEVIPGKRVVVIRQRADLEYEATVKELVEQGGRLWAVPRSSNPEFQAFPLDTNEPGIVETRISAIVVASVRLE
jgi:SOS-response transcriptional repressor LexA